MSIERVREYLTPLGWAGKILELQASSATVPLAAEALQVEPARIAKTLAFKAAGAGCLLVVAAGDAKIDNSKFKAAFGMKATMPSPQEVEALVGHGVGGVCPFGVNPGVPVYLDISLKRFATVFPACGSANSAIEMTPQQLYDCAGARLWVDVSKGWQPAE